MAKQDILQLLSGGDRRSLGRSSGAVALVAGNPRLFPELFRQMWSDDPVVCMRAADAVEKVTRDRFALLQPHKEELLGLLGEATQPELRWHLALLAPRLRLNTKERQAVVRSLENYLEDRGSIVKTHALQGLADLAAGEASLRAKVLEIIRAASSNGTAAMKARSRKLLLRLDRA